MRPSGIDVNGTVYPLLNGANAFRIVYESALARRSVISGRLGGDPEQVRPDILVWDWDDWSLGEGQKNIDTKKDNTFSKYLKSNGAVDIRVPGEIRLGAALSQSFNIGSNTNVPRLTATSNVWVAWDTSARELTDASVPTWTSRTTGLTNNLNGPIDAVGGRVFLGSEGGSAEVRRVTSSANAQWVASEGIGMCITDDRLYFVTTNTSTSVVLKHVPFTAGAPHTPTTVGTISGVDDFLGIACDGVNVYLLAGEDATKPRLHRWDGSEFVEFANLPRGFQIDSVKAERLAVLNKVLFVGGHTIDPHDNVAQPTLLWFTDQASGVVGKLRERGGDEKIRCLTTTDDDQVLFGTNKGRIYAYNMATGGIYEFASGASTSDIVDSMLMHGGRLYVAAHNSGAGTAQVLHSLLTGTGKYPSSVKVEGSRWDYDVPLEDKILLRVTIEGDFPTDTSAEFSFEANGGSEVTTDAAGSTMVANTTGATTFTLSSASVERTGKWFKPNITFKTSATGSTPILRKVSLEATTASRRKYLVAQVDLGARDPKVQTPSRMVTGSKAAQELETLFDSTNYIVTVKPFFEKAGAPHPRSSDSYTCLIDDPEIGFTRQGNAAATLRLRVL